MQNLQKQLDQYVSLRVGAEETGLNYFLLQRAAKKGEVPSIKLPGNGVGIRLEDAQAFAQSRAK